VAPAPGRIVLLSGPPRAGKSSIVTEVQRTLPGVWLNLGVDVMMQALPEQYRPGIGLRPGGERPDLEPLVAQLYGALFETIAAHSRLGLDVVADLGLHDDYSRPLGILAEAARRLAGLPVLLVNVVAPLESIMDRRNADPRGGFYAAGPGVPAPVERWQRATDLGAACDLRLDTSLLSPAECAARIGEALARPPTPGALFRA
jgi:chloramphenicol 3-O phosphotransferase